jgi:hypothetical protein
MKRQVLALSLAAALAAAAVPAHARHAVMSEPERVTLSAPQGKKADAKRVQAAIREAARQTGWVVRDDAAGKMTLKHTKGSHEAIVDVLYDAASYQIQYVSSLDLGYRSKGGKTEIHPLYNEWVGDLQKRIEHDYAGGAH